MLFELFIEIWPFQFLYLVELLLNLCICFAIMTLKLDLDYLLLIHIVSGRMLRFIYGIVMVVKNC